MSLKRHFVLAAGGTGGHMVPAHALATELLRRGHKVALITDDRGAKIPGLFDSVEVHILPAGRPGKSIGSLINAARSIWKGRKQARAFYRKFKPAAVIGFGGYPALPALAAALAENIPTAIHEQNAVLGRVNRLIAGQVDLIATSFAQVDRLKSSHKSKVELVGNPIRDEVKTLREAGYPVLTDDGLFRLLVTGGSLGASILSSVVPDALAMMPENFLRRLQVTQQCRTEDIAEVREKYSKMGVPADLATYIPDLPQKLGWSHLVIARAGASTLAEITAIGRPAILVPLPIATDDHQTANVREIVAAGGARSIQQPQFTPVELAKQMQKMALDAEALTNAARYARTCGRPDATEQLADAVERIAHTPNMDLTKVKFTLDQKNEEIAGATA